MVGYGAFGGWRRVESRWRGSPVRPLSDGCRGSRGRGPWGVVGGDPSRSTFDQEKLLLQHAVGNFKDLTVVEGIKNSAAHGVQCKNKQFCVVHKMCESEGW